MTYRELLEKCKNNPGCLSTKDQKETDSKIKYHIWMTQSNEDHQEEEK